MASPSDPLDIILFDTETTGLIKNVAIPLKEQPRIVELFMLKLRWFPQPGLGPQFDEVGTWHSLFHVKKIDADAIKTHGITLEELRDAPQFGLRFTDLCDFVLGTHVLVGHNLSFDRDQLDFEVRRLGAQCAFPWPPRHIDTVEATEGQDGFRLGLNVLHEKLFGESFSEAHRAEADTRALARCFIRLVETGSIVL